MAFVIRWLKGDHKLASLVGARMWVMVLAGALLLTGTVVAAPGDNPQGGEESVESEAHDREMQGGAITFKKVQTKTVAVVNSSTTFNQVTAMSFPIPATGNHLVNARFHAESACYEPGSVAPNWCSLRILIDGTEGHPQVGVDYAFDSTDRGDDTDASWEGHAMERHRCVRSTGAARNIVVELQRKVTNSDGGAAPSFRLDDWSLAVERSANCTPLN